jgi:hypothetical protein
LISICNPPLPNVFLSGRAGILSNIYRAENSHTNGADFADKIIAVTSCMYNLPIVTADVRDFPFPFFKQIDTHNLMFQRKNKENMISIALLKPDIQAENHWYKKTQ